MECAECIDKLKKIIATSEAKKKEENEKKYPCPHCNKELTIQQLKSQLNEKGSQHP